jgi:bacteriocin-like protein
MNNMKITELSHNDLIQISGGVDEVAYNAGYAAGQVVGKMVKNFLTLTGLARLFALL